MSWFVTLEDQVVQLTDLFDENALLKPLAANVWQFEYKGQTYVLALLPHELGGELWWRGQCYEIRVEPQDIHALRQHFKLKENASTDGFSVMAHMPGLVTQIKVQVGQAVHRGQAIAVLEAMKMENELVAPSSGMVAQLNVKVGQQVEKGSVLCVIRHDGSLTS